MSGQSESSFRIDQLPPYILGDVCEAVLSARREGRDVIDLSQFNPEAGPPGAAVERLVQSVLLPHNHRYSASRGITVLRKAIAQWYEQRHGVNIDPEREVVVTLGTKEGLSHLLLATLSPGDTVILPTPSYPIHAAAIFLAGAGGIGVSLRSDEDREPLGTPLSEKSEHFFARLSEAFNHAWPRPRFMVLSFPHNPTTLTVSSGFFERLVEFAGSNGIFLIHDFAYGDFTFDGYRAPSLLKTEGARDVAVEFYSLSKAFCIPGWRISFCIGNERLISALKRLKSYVDSGAFQPLQIAAARMLEHGDEVVSEVSGVYQARRNVLVEGLRRLGWSVPMPTATAFVWAGLPEALRPDGGLRVSSRLLSQADVAVCPGVSFDPTAQQFVRFSLVEKEPRMRLALQRMESLSGGNR